MLLHRLEPRIIRTFLCTFVMALDVYHLCIGPVIIHSALNRNVPSSSTGTENDKHVSMMEPSIPALILHMRNPGGVVVHPSNTVPFGTVSFLSRGREARSHLGTHTFCIWVPSSHLGAHLLYLGTQFSFWVCTLFYLGTKFSQFTTLILQISFGEPLCYSLICHCFSYSRCLTR